jgi:hypothetical protein
MIRLVFSPPNAPKIELTARKAKAMCAVHIFHFYLLKNSFFPTFIHKEVPVIPDVLNTALYLAV